MATRYQILSTKDLGANVATFLATPSSANLAAALTDETGTGLAVFNNTPTFIAPILGTPTSGTLTSCTGLPVSTGVSGLGANVATFLATPSSANLAAALTDETGSGAAVFGTSPTFTTSITTPSIISAASLGITPAAGNNLNVTLSGAGDLAVNTDVLYVDSSTGNVGVGTAIPAVKHQVVGVSRYGDQATNYATFAADGELTLVGTARVNRTIPLGIDGLAAGGVAPSIVRVVNFYGYEFSINDAGYVKGFELPYDWDSTTAISFKFHWACNNSSASKFIQWQLDYTSVAENTENINAATSTLPTGDLAVSTTPYRLTETSISISIAAAGLALDDVIGMQVKRIAASGGAGVVPDNEPIIIGLEIEFVSNKLGEAT